MEEKTYESVRESLMFLYVDELREVASKLFLVEKGNKMAVIMRILHFLKTGQRLAAPKFPEKSCSKRGVTHLLGENELMLKGAYKNDLKTRLFFKELIGEHFHFTAFGIDWLNERWMKGTPPTYLEFAKMWKEEYQKRKKSPAPPKEEWAYINFVQKVLVEFPKASRETINSAWEKEHQKRKDAVSEFLGD